MKKNKKNNCKKKIPNKKVVRPKISKIDTNKSQYTIKSVVSKDNMVIIDFNTNISKDYVKFFEKKKPKVDIKIFMILEVVLKMHIQQN